MIQWLLSSTWKLPDIKVEKSWCNVDNILTYVVQHGRHAMCPVWTCLDQDARGVLEGHGKQIVDAKEPSHQGQNEPQRNAKFPTRPPGIRVVLCVQKSGMHTCCTTHGNHGPVVCDNGPTVPKVGLWPSVSRNRQWNRVPSPCLRALGNSSTGAVRHGRLRLEVL